MITDVNRRRAAQRDQHRRRYWADPEYRAAILERNKAYQMRKRREAGSGPWKPKPPAPATCVECGVTFDRPRSPSDGRVLRRVTCSDACANARKGRNAPKGRGSRGGPIPACRVYFPECDQCGRMFCARASTVMRCGPRCRRAANAARSLEYQRRTHVTAIRYWRVAPTPEFEAIAREYWHLRQELRTRKSA